VFGGDIRGPPRELPTRVQPVEKADIGGPLIYSIGIRGLKIGTVRAKKRVKSP
jgi:hypothetical protein